MYNLAGQKYFKGALKKVLQKFYFSSFDPFERSDGCTQLHCHKLKLFHHLSKSDIDNSF